MKQLLIIACTISILASCNKNNDSLAPETEQPGSEQPANNPLVTEPGQPTGVMVQKTIGAAGGTITTADGSAQLVIPAGALDQQQTITLQPVESKLPQSIQKNAYRIGPANLPFKKEADLVIKYTNKDAHDASPDLMHAAAQESNGKWKMTGNIIKDKAAKTMTAKVKRAWDFSVFLEFMLEDNKTHSDTAVLSLLVREQVQFIVKRFSWVKDSTMEVPFPMPVIAKEIRKWSINGMVSPPVDNPYGYFIEEQEKNKMNYAAPIKVPDLDTVAVSVDLALDNRSTYILVRNVVIIDQNRLKLNGKWYDVKGAAISFGTGSLTITLSDVSNISKPVNATITMVGVTGPGTYDFSDITAVSARDASSLPIKDWSSWYTDQQGKNIHAGGSVTITAGGIMVGKPLEGRVEGELLHVVNINTGNIERASIYGSFGVILGG